MKQAEAEESKVKHQSLKADNSPRPFPGQHSGETVQLVFRQHPVVMRKTFITTMLLILLSIMPLFIWSTTSLVVSVPGFYSIGWKIFAIGVLVALAVMAYRWLGWYYSVYIVTDERIVEIKQKGFFDRQVSEFGLDKVQNVNYHISGLQGALLQFGDITAQTYVGDLVMANIHKPVHIHEQIVEVVRQFNSGSH